MSKKSSQQRSRAEYRSYVEHPRYGREPRFTDLNPAEDYAGRVFFHWHSPDVLRIANTAIPADLARQSPATIPVTHYFDVRRQCRDCGRPFIFFAREQKHWYEELGFPLESDCLCCVPCRKNQQGLARKRERYEELFHIAERNLGQDLEMADGCLALIEAGQFGTKQLARIKGILKRVEPLLTPKTRPAHEDLRARLTALEAAAAD